MITAASYLRDHDGTFVPVTEATQPPADPWHIEGAIDLTVNHVPILDQSLWDDVDQLWAYITDMLVGLAEGKAEVHTYFPDQPIELAFRRGPGGRVTVSCKTGDKQRTTTATQDELITTLREAGVAFFTALSRLAPANAAGYTESIDKLSAL